MCRVELTPGPNGERRRKNFTAKTQQAALDKKQRYLTSVARHILPEGNQRKFRDYAEWFLTEAAPHTCNTNTITNYRTALRLHILPIIGHLRLQEIRGHHIDEITATLADKGKSLATRKAVRRVASTVFTAARRSDLIDDNPVTRSIPPRTKPGETRKTQMALTPDQTAHLLLVLDNEKYGLYFETLIYTGMRRGEALALTWGDISFDGHNHFVTITKQVSEVRHYSPDGKGITTLEITQPKTSNGYRTVMIPEVLAGKLETTRISRSTDREDSPIFQATNGGIIWPSNVTKAWATFRKRMGLEYIKLHGLRHSFARNALVGGAPLESVSETLGHYSIQITKDTYATTIPGAARKTAEAFHRAVSPSIDIASLELSFTTAADSPG